MKVLQFLNSCLEKLDVYFFLPNFPLCIVLWVILGSFVGTPIWGPTVVAGLYGSIPFFVYGLLRYFLYVKKKSKKQ